MANADELKTNLPGKKPAVKVSKTDKTNGTDKTKITTVKKNPAEISTAKTVKSTVKKTVTASASKTSESAASTKNSPLIHSKSATYPYLAYTPQGYNKNDNKEWPLIIYLHGSSCKGNDLEKLKKYGPPFYLERGMQVDAIVISPQCPTNKNWTVGSWFESFYKELKDKYHFDPSRVYLTGMSLGGFGTWDIASRYPDYFAAIVPLCGGGKTSMVEKIKDIPTWVFHGDLDKKVKLSRSTEMVNAMKELGSDPKFSILKGQGHGIQKVYSDQTLYQWLFSQQKKAYERILEFSSFWVPKIDSVKTQTESHKNLVNRIFPSQTSVDKKKDKFSILDLFSKKESYKQETLY